MTQIYPWSRIATKNCPHCRVHLGRLDVRGVVEVGDGVGGTMRLLRLGCDGCGFTMLFDATVVVSAPYTEGQEELPPGFVL